jgi:hypothetical protein
VGVDWREAAKILESTWLRGTAPDPYSRPSHFNLDRTRFGNAFDHHFFSSPSKQGFTPLLLSKLSSYAPIFNFYIRKMDKNIRKNTRGKGRKYSIIWKYVPTYKRPYVSLRWLFKDLKFQKNFTFVKRLEKVFETFLFSPNFSFLPRLRKFVHLFVFFNYKLSLMQHLRSVS